MILFLFRMDFVTTIYCLILLYAGHLLYCLLIVLYWAYRVGQLKTQKNSGQSLFTGNRKTIYSSSSTVAKPPQSRPLHGPLALIA